MAEGHAQYMAVISWEFSGQPPLFLSFGHSNTHPNDCKEHHLLIE
jgi:hypothetical protein